MVDVQVRAPIGSSDHRALRVDLTLEQQVPQFSVRKEVYLKGRVCWDAVRDDLAAASWGDVYRSPEPEVAFADVLLNVVRRRVPSKVLRMRSTDKPWFTAECRRAYDLKQTAHHAWNRNRTRDGWNEFVRLRQEAEAVYARAEFEYNGRTRAMLAGTSQPHK